MGPTREFSTCVTTCTCPQRLSPLLRRDKLPEKPGQEHLLLPVLEVIRERVIGLLTEELPELEKLTKLELLVLALHPWSSEEGLAGASLLSNYLFLLSLFSDQK